MAEQKFTTSFIPKKPVQPINKGGVVVKSGASFMTMITTILFIATLVAAGGVFIYEITLNKKIDAQNQQLAKARDSFDPEFIAQATRLNNRLKSVQQLLDKHVAPSQIFGLLERETLRTIRFNSLQYSETNEGELSLNLSGLAKGFQSIVLQSDRYGNTGKIRDVLFSGLQPTEENLVSFDLEGFVDPRAVLYRNLISIVPVQQDNEDNEE